MTVRVEKLSIPAPSGFVLAALGVMSTMSALMLRWWHRPPVQTMSADWLNERARTDAQQGWE